MSLAPVRILAKLVLAVLLIVLLIVFARDELDFVYQTF